MPKIAFGLSAYRRDGGNLPELRVVNMFAEQAPTAKAGVVLMSRKGLAEASVIGDGPIQGQFQQPGTFDGDTFTVSAGVLYRETDELGAVTVSGPVSFASSGTEIVLTGGSIAYSYDGTDLQPIDIPDDQNIIKVEFFGSRFIYIPDNPTIGAGGYYWCDLDGDDIPDGRTIDPLNFANAESAPDGLLDALVVRDSLFLLGQRTIERHEITTDPDLPFQKIPHTTQARGVIATGCAVPADNTLHCIGEDGIFYRMGDVPEQLSDSGIEERIIASATRRLLRYDYEGHPLILIVLDDDAFAYDARTRQFHNPRSYGLDRFRASSAINVGTEACLGDEATNQVWTFSGWEDDGGPLERLFTAYFPLDAGSVAIDNLWIEANVGRTDLLSGQGSDPVAEMRYSRDAGATWSDWEASNLGEQGEYRVVAEWRALGTFDVPGAMFEIRVTDPIGFRVSAVHVNDPIPGRSR
jgi:hypothetical protein